MHWQPGADPDRLRARAALLASLRDFFAIRDVLEVETPQLCSAGVTDPALEPLVVSDGQSLSAPRYLQTSPEYAMKRLLASGSGPIFQICRAFRDGEAGSRHNPEFTLLEWYRPGFDHHRLMAEVVELLQHCLDERPVHKRSYRQWFLELLDTDPLTASPGDLEQLTRGLLDPGDLAGGRDLWLDLLMSHVIEPRLAELGICLVYDYPESQAALARLDRSGDAPVGQRFEVYVDGVELANGYFELLDPVEQRTRFERDNQQRLARGLPIHAIDEALLAAMEHGLPECSGVALGVDRLLMLSCGLQDIRQVLAFDWQRS
jgi:lysyl-tRNA synthetase class 2